MVLEGSRRRGRPGYWAGALCVNLSRPVIAKMVTEHVYSDPAWLTPERMAAKRAVTTPSGARHSSVRFVTGALDRVADRSAFLALAGSAGVPMLLVYGDETPPKSRAEMDAFAAAPGVETIRLPRGKLLIHEEFADRVAAEIAGFLDRVPPRATQDAATSGSARG